MAQRSARARVKLDKISQRDGREGPAPSYPPTSRQNSNTSQHASKPAHPQTAGVARLGSGGLLTPSASSVSGSSRKSLQLQAPPRIGKGTLRSFLDAQGEKLRGRLAHGHRREGSDGTGASNFYTGLGGVGTGLPPSTGLSSLGSLGSIGEEKIVVKRWEGGGSKGEIWDGGGKGKKDLELWFPDGDTLVYLTERPQPSRNPQGLYKPPVPQPSFRLRSSVLRNTESPFLIAQLEESFVERPPTPSTESVGSPADDAEDEDLAMDYEYQLQRSKSMASSGLVSNADSVEAGIQYRLYFPAPPRQDKVSRHRHHLTTRNFFAVLFNKPLVGITLGQTLLDLVERTDIYLSSSSPLTYEGMSEIESPYSSLHSSRQQHSKAPIHALTHRLILDYLQNREFDDVRNWPEGAAGLVVWTERAAPQNLSGLGSSEIQRIEAMWREGFIHCTGMLASLEGASEWREISPITKALIDRASLEIQVRVSEADQRLIGFNFDDIWPVMSATSPSARLAFEKFQKFLIKHYHSRFGAWPPQDGRLSRTYYVHLQRDFAALYDYLVDRDAIWSPSHDQHLQPNQRRRIIKPHTPTWRADDDDLAITDILQSFDQQNNHPPIPHPFPLVPAPPLQQRLGHHCSITSNSPPLSNKRQQRFFATSSSASLRNRAQSNPAAALALTESTNIETLYSSRTVNPLVEAFTAHEKSVPPSECTPHDARKGRWILIYAILQTLASVAVDAPGVRWADGVEYFVNAKLRGTPPWKSHTPASDEAVDERSHFRSHCWVAGRSPPINATLYHNVSLPMQAASPAPGAAPSSSHSHSSSIPNMPEMSGSPSSPPPSRSREKPARNRSRSRSRNRLGSRRKDRERANAHPSTEMMSVEMEMRRSNSGDEGDDEMDEGGSSPPAYGERRGSTPPPVAVKTERDRDAQKMRWQDAWGAGAVPDGEVARLRQAREELVQVKMEEGLP